MCLEVCGSMSVSVLENLCVFVSAHVCVCIAYVRTCVCGSLRVTVSGVRLCAKTCVLETNLRTRVCVYMHLHR